MNHKVIFVYRPGTNNLFVPQGTNTAGGTFVTHKWGQTLLNQVGTNIYVVDGVGDDDVDGRGCENSVLPGSILSKNKKNRQSAVEPFSTQLIGLG